jgi:spore protease
MTSSITPGVMSATGIESADIIKAVIKKIKPSFVIAVDALSAGSIERIVKTIQITDTGIHPGSGIGNNRTEISNKTVSVPVIAIGIPTVTSSSTIVLNTIEYLTKHIAYLKNNEEVNRLTYLNRNYLSKLKDNELSKEERINLLGLIGSLNTKETNNLINEVLNKTSLNSIVTPTEIDFLINKLSLLISSAINNTLHNI